MKLGLITAGTRGVALSAIFILMVAGSVRGQWSVQWQNAIELNRTGFDVDELSGVSLINSIGNAQDSFLVVSDEDGGVIQFTGSYGQTGLTSAVASDAWQIDDQSLDTEGIALHPDLPGSMFIAYERDTNAGQIIPGIRQYNFAGERLQTVGLPSVWTTNGNVRSNRGFESLAWSTGGSVMWTANEEALTIDGAEATASKGTTVRLQQLAVNNGTVSAAGQFAYEVDPIHSTNSPDRSGLADLVVLPDGTLITLERSAAVTIPGLENRIYQVDLAAATDISDPQFNNGLIGASYAPVTKTLLWSGSASGLLGANMEGLALGTQRNDGTWPLVGVVDNGGGDTGNLIVSFQLTAPTAYGDFDLDGDFDCDDIDALTAEIVAGTNAADFDLTGDGLVNGDDQSEWLVAAAVANELAGPYLPGDVDLDGTVDGVDFVIWNSNKFTSTPGWCSGDLNHDGFVNGADFIIWNGNKFTSSSQTVSAVPEPTIGWSICWVVGLFYGLSRRELAS